MNDDLRNREFLGRGLAFPLQVDPRGGIALSTAERDIEQAIQIILETVPGERVMRPEFGCRIHELIFASNNASTQGLIIRYVEEALERWEPRVEVREVEVTSDPNSGASLLVEIKYQIKDTHDERSIVYPFFLMGEE
jgi:uncharacterized protein